MSWFDESCCTNFRSGQSVIATALSPCDVGAEGEAGFGLSSAHAAMTAHTTMSAPRSTCRPALLWNIFTITNHTFFAVQDSWRRARHGNAENEKQHKIGHALLITFQSRGRKLSSPLLPLVEPLARGAFSTDAHHHHRGATRAESNNGADLKRWALHGFLSIRAIDRRVRQ